MLMKQEQFAARPSPSKHQISDYDCKITVMPKNTNFVII